MKTFYILRIFLKSEAKPRNKAFDSIEECIAHLTTFRAANAYEFSISLVEKDDLTQRTLLFGDPATMLRILQK